MTSATQTVLPYEGATLEQLRHPRVREFLGIHRMFRRELEKILRFVDSLLASETSAAPAQPAAAVEQLAQATYQYTQYLHLHHQLESSRLFPALQAEGLAGSIVERLEAEHWEIAALLDQFDRGVQRLTEKTTQQFSRDLRRLADLLHQHLAYEETHVCPLLPQLSAWPARH